MKQVDKLLGYRESVKVLDATIRDGGLVNDCFFDYDFVGKLYKANAEAGVDYMEIGYRASKKVFDESKYGKWKFSSDEDILKAIGEKDPRVKIAIMADIGRHDKNDFDQKVNSPVDMVRVATYIHQLPEAIEMIEDAANKGYETTCNIMAISQTQENDLKCALDMIGQTPVNTIYVVDSFGSIYPEEMARICDIYGEFAAKYNKKLGIHAHNNQQLAFANTIEACGDGVDFLDATYMSMGRGAGNCAMELLLGFLKNPKYNVFPVLKFLEEEMPAIRAKSPAWGYDIPYLMTGSLNQHPRSAIKFIKDGRTDYSNFYSELLD